MVGVTHAEPPQSPGAGPRELIDETEHVTGRELHQGLRNVRVATTVEDGGDIGDITQAAVRAVS
jgi:hypothetical protein